MVLASPAARDFVGFGWALGGVIRFLKPGRIDLTAEFQNNSALPKETGSAAMATEPV
jgi:hypothetical protein